MVVDIEKLTARSVEVAARIEVLREQLDPLRAELASLNRRIAGTRLGQTTTAHRAEKTKKRNRAICADAMALAAHQSYLPAVWLQMLAKQHGLSPRQVRRILEEADIKVESWR